MGLAFGRQRVLPASGVLAGGLDQAEVFEQRQRRVDRAGARAVVAADPVADGLDDFVAVARLLTQQMQHQQLEVTAIEHAAAPAATTTMTTGAATEATAAPTRVEVGADIGTPEPHPATTAGTSATEIEEEGMHGLLRC